MADIKIGLIGGSGLGEVVRSQTTGTPHRVETPFGPPSDAIIETSWDGLQVFFLPRHGPGHVFGPSQVPFRANIFALKKLGCTHLIASGAVGSLRDEFRPRDLVVADQVIDKTYRRDGTFFEKAAVHAEFAEPFCPILRRILIESAEFGTRRTPETAKATGTARDTETAAPQDGDGQPITPYITHDRGCYVCMEGPAFSSRAESLMHRLWGGDLIGMTAMPEAKLAREAEMGYALVALVTDYDCWRRPAHAGNAPAEAEADPAVLLKEIIANLAAASDNAVRLIRRAVSQIATQAPLREALIKSPALQSLQLAIWSDKSRIPRDEVELLAPLWMRYFEAVANPAAAAPSGEAAAAAAEPAETIAPAS